MKVTELRLENFKCFEKLDLKLNKLTLLTGANSSGKSSAIYGLMSPFQSSEFPLHFSTNGKYVNMGDFEDISYLHKRNSTIKIGFTLDNKTNLNIDTFWIYDNKRKLPLLSKFIIKEDFYDLSLTRQKNNKLVLEFLYNREKDPNKHFYTLGFQKKINQFVKDIINEGSKEENRADEYLEEIQNKLKKNRRKIRFTINSVEELQQKIYKNGNFALMYAYPSITKLFQDLDEKTNYISSFRFHPQKIRNEISKVNLRIGKYGDNYEDQILYWETRKDENFRNLVSSLKEVGVLQDIKPARLAGGNFELRVKTHSRGVYDSLTDVGFGISQFLPIVVSDLQLGKSSTLVVSQPEIHLHPQIQSAFGQYLLTQISKNKKNYVIETHSEYLINRIRLLIVEKKLKASDVNIYYFHKKGNKVEKFELEFTIDGQIKNAPKDFFDTYMTDVMKIALNA